MMVSRTHSQMQARACAAPAPAPSAPLLARARRRTTTPRRRLASAAATGSSGGGAAAAGDRPPPPPDPPSVVLPPTSAPFPDVDARERALLYLTDAEAEARVDAAAGLLSALDDLRPLDRASYSASEHVWGAIAEIPATDRVRLLDALDAGGCRQMWRHTVGRYALPRERAERAFRGYTVWRDLPPAEEEDEGEDDDEWEMEEEEEEEGAEEEEGKAAAATGDSQDESKARAGSNGDSVGASAAPSPPPLPSKRTPTRANNTNKRNKQVVEFDGVCERLVVESAPVRAQRPGDKAPIDLPPPSSAAADLRPRPGRALRRVRRFRFQLFRHARTGQPYARVVLPSAVSSALFPGLELPGPSCYCRLDFGLALTPVRRDAGAEVTLAWPSADDPDLGGLTKADLPRGLGWPAPVRWSEDWKRVRRGFGGGWWRAFAGGGGGEEGGEEEGGARGGGGGGGGGEEEADGAEAGAPGVVGAASRPGSRAEGWSPFSWTDRDYVRPAGPGVYVGCGYRPTDGLLVEDEFVWFALAKRVDGDEFGEEDEEGEEGEGGAGGR
jgi:hypothetical protein